MVSFKMKRVSLGAAFLILGTYPSLSTWGQAGVRPQFEEGHQDAIEGIRSRCQSKADCPSQDTYKRGYKRGHKKGIRELKNQGVRPLIDSPGKTIGSDFNGDGVHDFIVGAHGNNDGGINNEGAAYVIFGATDLSGTRDMGGSPKTADVTILGKAATDQLGRSVSGAGDLNGDGFDDLIVGAYANNDGAADAGAAYVIFGASNLSGTRDMGGSPLTADVTILGKAASDRLGFSVSGAGDVNGDGFDDLIVGADVNDDGASPSAGAAYVIFGASDLSGMRDMGGSPLTADVTILGKAAYDFLGRSV